MCTHTQGPNFNVAPLPAADPDTANQPNDRAYGLKILQNNDVLVADTNDVVVLDPDGNVLNTYPCSNLPGCQGGLFAMAIDPSGTSFWTGDEISGYVWQVDIGTGQVMQTINTNAGLLYGLSVDNEINVATASDTVVAGHADVAQRQPGLGQLLVAHAGLGRPHRLGHQHADPGRAGDLHPQRHRDLHRHHRQHRDGHLRHHAGRALELVHLDRLVRR